MDYDANESFNKIENQESDLTNQNLDLNIYSNEDELSNENSSEITTESDDLSDYDFDNLSDIDDQNLVEEYKKYKKNEIKEYLDEEEKKKLIITNFSNEQMERFEAYRRMTINKPSIKKIFYNVTGHSISNSIAVVISGICKLYLGEIITKSFEMKKQNLKAKMLLEPNHSKNKIFANEKYYDKCTPLKPKHVKDGWKMYNLENSGILPFF